MPEVEIHQKDGQVKSTDVLPNTVLLDAANEAKAVVPHGCRKAICGSCRVKVLEGGDILSPIEGNERRKLQEEGYPEGTRLSCQAVVQGEGTLRVEVMENEDGIIPG